MGTKGKKGRLKRKPAPRFWPIHRKEFVWAVRPSPGPHSLEHCVPLSIILRDYLKVVQTRKEAKMVVSQGKISVDGKVRRKDDFPVGLMDVLSIGDLKKYFRVVSSHKGLFLQLIKEKEASFKLCRVEDTVTVKNGNVQVNFHDGTNIFLRADDPKSHPESIYETFDVLKLSLPKKEVVKRIKLKEGNYAVITGGKNMGKHGRIIEIEKTAAKKRKNALVVVEDEKGGKYQTILDYVFSVGATQPLIQLQEEDLAV